MLQAKTEEQLRCIAKILKLKEDAFRELITLPEHNVTPIHSIITENEISFDQMAEIVGYLRRENEEVEIPTTCRVSADSDGVVYCLYDTPHEDVIQFCKKLACVKGKDFGYYYEQYITNGRIVIQNK